MTSVRISSFLCLVFILFFWTGCATVSAPTGGPKDAMPPVVLSTSFPNGEPNFTEKSIIIEFNEFIKLKSGGNNIYSSPPLGNAVSFVPKKNKLFVIFREDLEPNTTYHINFGNSIEDVNESNSMNSYQFVFATGEEIDSLSYSGRIMSQEEKLIDENTLIGLYPELDDSAFVKGPPFYFTFVEPDGSFNLKYLKAHQYQPFALKDANNNFYYDLPNEAIGFADSSINLTKNIAQATIELFQPESDLIRIKSFDTKVSNYRIGYELSGRLPSTTTFQVLVKVDSIFYQPVTQLSEDRLNITAWLDRQIDSVSQIQSILRMGDETIDTFSHTISNLKVPNLEIRLRGSKFTKNDSLLFESSNPIVRVENKFALLDTLKADSTALIATQVSDFQLFIPHPKNIAQNVVYTLLRDKNAITDIFGQASIITKHEIEFEGEDTRGTIRFNFEGADSSMQYLLQLKNENSEIISRLNYKISDENWEITNLIPGSYTVSIIEDQNFNGVWNSGTLFPRSLPEKKYDYGRTFTIRANWDVEETIKLDTQ